MTPAAIIKTRQTNDEPLHGSEKFDDGANSHYMARDSCGVSAAFELSQCCCFAVAHAGHCYTRSHEYYTCEHKRKWILSTKKNGKKRCSALEKPRAVTISGSSAPAADICHVSSRVESGNSSGDCLTKRTALLLALFWIIADVHHHTT